MWQQNPQKTGDFAIWGVVGTMAKVMFSDLARLFATPLRIKLIKYFLLQPDGRFLLLPIARSIGANKKLVQRELSALERVGVVVSRSQKGGRVYGWNKAHAHAYALQNFVIATTTPDDSIIASAFKKIGVSLVVAAGILANETRGSVDLLLVTRRPRDPRIAAAVRKFETMTAVPIRYTVMDVPEYQSRTQGYDRTIRDIMDFKHRVILGRVSAGG